MNGSGETRDGVTLTNLDQPLFPGAGATKRDLVDYLDAVADRILPELAGKPLSVIRVLRGQAPFMQKNLPKYAPSWVKTIPMWAYASHREVHYPLCDDRRTLLWFANQRAVEYHPMLTRVDQPGSPVYMVLDLDPPEAPDAGPADGGAGDAGTAAVTAGDAGTAGFRLAARAAHLIHEALTGAGLAGAVKTSGAKGVHVFVPVEGPADAADVAAATRAIAARAERLDPALATTAFIREDRGGKVFLDSTRAGGATVAAAYSPRTRPGLPVSFPVGWDELDNVTPGQFTVHTAVRLLGTADPWAAQMPAPQRLDPGLIAEGHTIPVARVQAMHEGKRRARARREQSDER
jgi:bifunctional non-homologous end joining protein LigD